MDTGCNKIIILLGYSKNGRVASGKNIDKHTILSV